MHVEHAQVHELRAGAVGMLGDRADHLLLAGFGGDRDHLAGLHVGSEADDQLGHRVGVALDLARHLDLPSRSQGMGAAPMSTPGLRMPAGSSVRLTERSVRTPSSPISRSYHGT